MSKIYIQAYFLLTFSGIALTAHGKKLKPQFWSQTLGLVSQDHQATAPVRTEDQQKTIANVRKQVDKCIARGGDPKDCYGDLFNSDYFWAWKLYAKNKLTGK